jgi:hypothetical protein
MFNDKFTKIGDEIYVYKNFVSEEELEEINNFILSLNENEWHEENKQIKWMSRTNSVKIMDMVIKKIEGVLGDGMTLGGGPYIIRMNKGYSWGVHQDDYEHKDVVEKVNSYIEGDPFELADLSVYGLVVYFNNFEGGEIFYPEQNIEYKPKSGDMVIHGTGFYCRHGVKEVLSDFRYSHSNNIFKKAKIAKE